MENKMLETKIKEALFKQKADDFCAYVIGSGAYNTLVREMYRELESGLGDDIVLEMSPKEGELKKGVFEKRKKEVLKHFRSIYDNPEEIRKMFIEEDRREYIAALQQIPNFKNKVESLKQLNKGSEKIVVNLENSFKDCIEEVFKHITVRDTIVKRLAQIAENEGIDKAMQKETRYKITKEFFPTPLDYRLHSSKIYNLQNKTTQLLKNVLTETGEGEELEEVIRETERSVRISRKFCEFFQKLNREYTECMVKEVYPEFRNSYMPKE